ncbi:hypothetical protein PMAYCL1PPCAC_29775, partial [Pristionchus mayeri]
ILCSDAHACKGNQREKNEEDSQKGFLKDSTDRGTRTLSSIPSSNSFHAKISGSGLANGKVMKTAKKREKMRKEFIEI